MGIDIATLGIEVRSDGVLKANRRMERLVDVSERTERAAEKMRRQMQITTTAIKVLSGAAAAMATVLLSQSIKAFASFDQSLRNVASVSGATAAQFDDLRDAALGAAASTRFTPEQTTSALYSLASSGQAAAEQIATLPNVLNLAEAAQADLGRTTELVTATLNQFGLDANQSGRLVDVFTASIGASAFNVARLQVAFRNAGPTAAALNQSLEGTTATLAILTSSFGSGERAGTGFRAILNELPDKADELGLSLYDANGAMRPFVDILGDLEKSGLTASGAVRLLGAEAGPSLAALLSNGSDALLEMENRLVSTGQAADVAATQLDTLKGDFDKLASAISVALIQIGSAQSETARQGVQIVTDLIVLWSGFGDTLGDTQAESEQLSAAIIAGLTGVATAFTVLLIPAIVSATAAFGAFTIAMLANPLVQLALLSGTLAGALVYLSNTQETARQAAQTHAEAVTTNANAIETAKTSSQGFRDALREQISAQLAAANMALTEAYAQAEAMKIKAQAADLFGVAMNAAAQAIGLEGRDVNYGGNILAGYATGIDAIRERILEIQDQLDKLADVEANFKPVEPIVHSLATALAAANDNALGLRNGFDDLTNSAEQFAKSIGGTFKSAFTGFFRDFTSELATGTSFWQAFASAGLNALGSIADKMLEMASSQLFDAIFGAVLGGFGGGFGANFSTPGTFNIGNLSTYSSGGYTGGGALNAAAGIVHGQEYVLNASATSRIGVPTLNAMNAGQDVSANSNVASGPVNVTVNLTVNGNTSAEVIQEIRSLETRIPYTIKRVMRDPNNMSAA